MNKRFTQFHMRRKKTSKLTVSEKIRKQIKKHITVSQNNVLNFRNKLKNMNKYLLSSTHKKIFWKQFEKKKVMDKGKKNHLKKNGKRYWKKILKNSFTRFHIWKKHYGSYMNKIKYLLSFTHKKKSGKKFTQHMNKIFFWKRNILNFTNEKKQSD